MRHLQFFAKSLKIHTMKKLTMVISFVLCAFSAQVFAYDWQKDGERLTFDIAWSFIHVGSAELLLKNNPESYEIIGRAWTDDSYNSLYKLRDRIRIHGVHKQAEKRPFMPHAYRAELYENDYRAHKLVELAGQNKAIYTNVHKNAKPFEFEMETNSRDMISALYALRSMEQQVKVGGVYTLPVVHYDRNYTFTLRILEKERMETMFGKVEVYEIQPVLERDDGKKKKKKDKLRLWVTADGRFIPVKIEIDLKIGSFKAELTNAKAAKSDSVVPESIPEDGDIDFYMLNKNENLYR